MRPAAMHCTASQLAIGACSQHAACEHCRTAAMAHQVQPEGEHDVIGDAAEQVVQEAQRSLDVHRHLRHWLHLPVIAPRNVQRAPRNVHHATCTTQRAPHNVHHDVEHAGEEPQLRSLSTPPPLQYQYTLRAVPAIPLPPAVYRFPRSGLAPLFHSTDRASAAPPTAVRTHRCAGLAFGAMKARANGRARPRTAARTETLQRCSMHDVQHCSVAALQRAPSHPTQRSL